MYGSSTMAATGTVVSNSTSATPSTAARCCGSRPSVATRTRPSCSGCAVTTPSTDSRLWTRSGVATSFSAVSTNRVRPSPGPKSVMIGSDGAAIAEYTAAPAYPPARAAARTTAWTRLLFIRRPPDAGPPDGPERPAAGALTADMRLPGRDRQLRDGDRDPAGRNHPEW